MTHAPLPTPERHQRLDQLRGLAVLGILPVNILLFSGPFAALANPMVWGELRGPNAVAWWLTRLLFEQKFLTLFCILFGAGLVMQRLHLGPGPDAWRVHRRRMAFLFVLGLVHAYAIWYGDILAPYAICGLLLWPATRWPAVRLWSLGLMLLTVPSIINWLAWFSLSGWSGAALEALERSWQPHLADLLTEIAAYRGDWFSQLRERVPQALYLQLQLFPLASGWRLLGSMLLGMAAMRTDLLTGAASLSGRTLRTGAWVLAGLGLALTAWGGQELLVAGKSPIRAALLSGQPLYWGSLAMAWAYLLLFPRQGFGGWAGISLACVGRTALSNYLLQSLLCTGIFYGTGLAMFGQLQRWQLLLMALTLGAGQLIVSRLWLSAFERGPLEQLWRRLSYRA
ncbi:MAG: DUF418 domain-containing protein [Gammaproteobacteria bacterium]|nr:DUF418 domain-containing protein [Gammaproteobacteria bacterium]